MLLEGKKYVYDDIGNLKEIRESTGDFSKLVEYAYDSQNQLTSEAYYKSGEAEAYITYNYTYDTAGNLLTVSQKKGNTTTLLQTYTYGDAQWHDLLTAVNGQAITYDASGNPLSYGGWSFGWQNGRQLKTASKTSDGKTETLEYSYDADGIRTSKTYTVETFTQVPDYTVTFQADGATVKTMTVEDGYTLKDSDYPAVPTKTGYTGEWVKYTTAIHSNVTVQAKYTAVVAKYTVTFKADNTVVKTMTVKDGYTLKASDYPTVPAKSGYTGEWVKYTSAIHSNVTVQAKYTAVVTKYTVFFKADGFTVKAIQVNDGYVLQDADYPEVPAKVGCNGAWEKHTAAIHSNVTINAVYSPIASHYTVTFKANGKTLKTMTVADGYVLKTSDYPAIPKRAGYTGSWPKTGAIHANTTITAVYTKDSGIVIPTQPTSPGEIMSGSEGEPVEADVPAEDETVAPQGTHVTGIQTVTHEYLTLNGKVARETIRTNNTLTAVLDFIYDESGKPFALKYSTNGTSFQTYYYVLNLQGDVVKLIHYIPGFEYESVATYEYDAWGNVSSSGRLAEINPLRYRGYYYDNETGFYYLQSRYYDPANRRFINADSLASTGQGFLGTNMFAYCNNCPTIYEDPSGHALRSNLALICDGGSGKTEPRYISDQDLPGIAPTPFGHSNVGNAGCGAVATYNALQTLNSGTSLNSIISYYQSNNKMNLNGHLGLMPSSVIDYFLSEGYSVLSCEYTMEYSVKTAETVNSLSQSADASILWYVYVSDSGVGAHFFEYHRDGDGYVGYNVFNNHPVYRFSDPYKFLRNNYGVVAVSIFIYQGG